MKHCNSCGDIDQTYKINKVLYILSTHTGHIIYDLFKNKYSVNIVDGYHLESPTVAHAETAVLQRATTIETASTSRPTAIVGGSAEGGRESTAAETRGVELATSLHLFQFCV